MRGRAEIGAFVAQIPLPRDRDHGFAIFQRGDDRRIVKRIRMLLDNALDDDTIKSSSNAAGVVATAERVDPNLFAFPADGFSIAPAPRHWGVRANTRF